MVLFDQNLFQSPDSSSDITPATTFSSLHVTAKLKQAKPTFTSRPHSRIG